MIAIGFKTKKKQFISCLIMLFLYTYALSGAVISLSSTNYFTNFGIITSCNVDLNIICLLIIAFTYVIEKVTKHIKFNIKTNNLIFSINLTQGNKMLRIPAYLDTGNMLNYNGQPIIVLDLEIYLRLSNLNLIDFLLNCTNKTETSTVSGKNNLKLIKIDRIEITNNRHKYTFTNQYVAINQNNIFKHTNYKALLPVGLF